MLPLRSQRTGKSLLNDLDRGSAPGWPQVLLDATEYNMKSKCSAGVATLALAVAAVLCSDGQAFAHRWHGSRGFGWGAARHGYYHSYYPAYAYGPGFVYAPDYAAMVYNYAYFYQRRAW
jgi:hypothetical protein